MVHVRNVIGILLIASILLLNNNSVSAANRSKCQPKQKYLPVPFYNVNGTCYANAILQAFLAFPSFRRRILQSGNDTRINRRMKRFVQTVIANSKTWRSGKRVTPIRIPKAFESDKKWNSGIDNLHNLHSEFYAWMRYGTTLHFLHYLASLEPFRSQFTFESKVCNQTLPYILVTHGHLIEPSAQLLLSSFPKTLIVRSAVFYGVLNDISPFPESFQVGDYEYRIKSIAMNLRWDDIYRLTGKFVKLHQIGHVMTFVKSSQNQSNWYEVNDMAVKVVQNPYHQQILPEFVFYQRKRIAKGPSQKNRVDDAILWHSAMKTGNVALLVTLLRTGKYSPTFLEKVQVMAYFIPEPHRHFLFSKLLFEDIVSFVIISILSFCYFIVRYPYFCVTHMSLILLDRVQFVLAKLDVGASIDWLSLIDFTLALYIFATFSIWKLLFEFLVFFVFLFLD